MAGRSGKSHATWLILCLCAVPTLGFLVPSTLRARFSDASGLRPHGGAGIPALRTAPPRIGATRRRGAPLSSLRGSAGEADAYKLASQLAVAVEKEEYKEAARLRDMIVEVKKKDPVQRSRDAIATALEGEDFAAAAEAKISLARAITDRAAAPDKKVNRLLVQTKEGGLQTCDPSGKTVVPLSDDDPKGQQHFQPTWSPTGDMVACTIIDTKARDSTASEVRIVWASDGATHVAARGAFVPFYFYWTPSGARLTYLTTHAADAVQSRSVSLDVIKAFQDDGAGPSLNELLDEGRTVHLQDAAPLYYAHSPRDNRIVAHLGDKGKVVAFEPATLSEVVLSSRPGDFRAPAWVPVPGPKGEEMCVFVEGSELLLAEVKEGGKRKTLCLTQGSTMFSVSPDGQKVAVLCEGDRRQDGGYLSFVEGPFEFEDDPWPSDRVSVAGAYPDRSSDLPPPRSVLAFFWSPDGRKLLVLTGPSKADIEASSGGLRWEVFDTMTGHTEEFELFRPTAAFVGTFLPFFDQYALSHRVWAPDSASFCYTGASLMGDEMGAFVQEVPARGGEKKLARLVVEGADMVSWSPT